MGNNVNVSMSKGVLKEGMDALQAAFEQADQPIYKFGTLPREANRKAVKDKLNWHSIELSKIAYDPSRVYYFWDDLKKYVLQAFEEKNATEQGDITQSKAWDEFKKEANPLNQPFGVPNWVWIAGAVALAGGIGYLYLRPYMPARYRLGRA